MKNVTFYIPTLDSAKTIKKCINSIKEQGISIKKIFVIDDDSKDNTLDIVRSLKVEVLKKEKKGLANSRNIALKHCKTEYVAFVDSDVVLHKKWLSDIMSSFSKKEIAGVGGNLIEKNTKKLADRWRSYHLNQHWGDNITEPEFLYGSNVVFKKEALLDVGGFRAEFKTNYEDVDICNRLKEKGYKIIYEPYALAYHLKKDTIISVMKTARRWSFYSYPVPNTFPNLLIRLLIYNPYWTLYHILKDIVGFRLLQFTLTATSLFYFEYYDIKYYFKN